MVENKLFEYIEKGIEIIITGDINPISKELDIKGIIDKDCINIYIENKEQKISYINHKKERLINYMKAKPNMGGKKYVLINLLTKDRLKLQAMMSLGFSFEDSLYELYIKDKKPILHSYS